MVCKGTAFTYVHNIISIACNRPKHIILSFCLNQFSFLQELRKISTKIYVCFHVTVRYFRTILIKVEFSGQIFLKILIYQSSLVQGMAEIPDNFAKQV
jgi:hypothetical protein